MFKAQNLPWPPNSNQTIQQSDEKSNVAKPDMIKNSTNKSSESISTTGSTSDNNEASQKPSVKKRQNQSKSLTNQIEKDLGNGVSAIKIDEKPKIPNTLTESRASKNLSLMIERNKKKRHEKESTKSPIATTSTSVDNKTSSPKPNRKLRDRARLLTFQIKSDLKNGASASQIEKKQKYLDYLTKLNSGKK